MKRVFNKRSERIRNPASDDPLADPTLIGYARVSTDEQNLDMQIAALLRAGVHADHIHTEKVSGVASQRPGRDLALKDAREGDTFVVWRLDRVGRSLLDLLQFVQKLDTMGVKFKSLQDSIDTGTPAGRVMFAMLGAFAQFERDVIAERTRAGVARARERGQKFGQPPKVHKDNYREIEEAIHRGERMADIAKRHGMSQGCLRMWYPADALTRIRAHGPRQQPPKQKRKQ